MGKKTGSKVAHPTRRYPRREELYQRRMTCGVGAGKICAGAGIHSVDYFRLEQARGKNSISPISSEVSLRNTGWKEIAVKLADYYLCGPEDLFPEEAGELDRRRIRAERFHGVAESLMSDYAKRATRPPDEYVEMVHLRKILTEALRLLTSTQRIVVRGTLGLLGEPISFEALGLMCGMTEQAALSCFQWAMYRICAWPRLDALASFSSRDKDAALRRKRRFRHAFSVATRSGTRKGNVWRP